MPAQFIFIGIGLWCIGGGLWAFYIRCKARAWVDAKGKITKSKVRPVLSRQYSEEFEVAYRFFVNGEEYYGCNKTPGGFDTTWSISFPGLSSAQGDKAKYPEGAEVQVFFNPSNPKQNALEQPSYLSPIILIVIGIGVCLAPIFLDLK